MFRLLSKESNIFSIPFYIGILMMMIMVTNYLHYDGWGIITGVITFLGISLGYFCIHSIGLNYHTHLPLVLYTFMVFAFYPGYLDIGIATLLLSNSFIILILTNPDSDITNKSNVLIGSILAINFIVLPASWPMIFFVLLHIFSTSNRFILQLFRIIFGGFMVFIVYLSLAYFLGSNDWDIIYLPFYNFVWEKDFSNYLVLAPLLLLLIYGVMDHFLHYNKKSPVSRYKYTFLLVFAMAQLITIFLYMNQNFEFILLFALPFSIIISRTIHFQKKNWIKEMIIWIIILNLVFYKFYEYFLIK